MSPLGHTADASPSSSQEAKSQKATQVQSEQQLAGSNGGPFPVGTNREEASWVALPTPTARGRCPAALRPPGERRPSSQQVLWLVERSGDRGKAQDWGRSWGGQKWG